MRNHFNGRKQLSGNIFYPHELVIIGLDTDDGVEHPLHDGAANDEPVNETLVMSIEKHGFFGSIIGQRIGEQVLVEDGRQRVKAACVAYDRATDDAGRALTMVPVIFRDGGVADLIGTVIASNEHRRDIPVIEKARLAAKLRNAGESIDDVAITFGVSGQAIRQWLDLLKTAPDVQNAVSRGDLSATAAVEVKDLSPAQQKETLAKANKAKGQKRQPSVKQVKAAMPRAKPANRRAKDIRAILGVANTMSDGLPFAFITGVRWALGDITDEEACIVPVVAEWQARPAKKKGV